MGRVDFVGTGSIHSTIHFRYNPLGNTLNFLMVGFLANPVGAIPPGVAACDTGAPVTSLYLQPFTTVVGTTSAPLDYWLYLPNHSALVGLTLAAQGVALQSGAGNAPFWPSQVLAFDVQP